MEIKYHFTQTKILSIIIYDGVEYTRKESTMNTPFHTITWFTGSEHDSTYELVNYYEKSKGWNDVHTGKLSNTAPVPELEKLYQSLSK